MNKSVWIFVGLLMMSGAVARGASAADRLTPGQFNLFLEPRHKPTQCDRGVRLVLDNAEIKGSLAFMENFVEGMCPIAVIPNPRFYELRLQGEACGSLIYKGSRQTEEGVEVVTITDHRRRVCRDIVPAEIVVEVLAPVGETHTLYSALDYTNELPPVTCMAYWTGFEFDSEKGTCVRKGRSGCGNPFKFETLDACLASLR